MAEKKNYYAIIPAPIRYDKQLKDKAKMLYGEVTALANELGYCYASNAYFADLYGVRKETISRLLSDLQQKQYIRIELIYQGKEIKERRIYISENQCLLPNKSTPLDQNVNTPIDQEVKENNTSLNTTINNKYPYQDIVLSYNNTCKSFPRLTVLSEARKKAIQARINTGYTLEHFKQVFEMAEQSDFLKGKNDRNWRATFDWLIKDANMAKVLDGNYSSGKQDNVKKGQASVQTWERSDQNKSTQKIKMMTGED